MSVQDAQKALTQLRDLSPYFLLEPLLPGGALIALLLWLSQRFIRNGFGDVRQYLFGQRFRAAISAKVETAKRMLCRCVRASVFLSNGPNGFRARCESLAAEPNCCASGRHRH